MVHAHLKASGRNKEGPAPCALHAASPATRGQSTGIHASWGTDFPAGRLWREARPLHSAARGSVLRDTNSFGGLDLGFPILPDEKSHLVGGFGPNAPARPKTLDDLGITRCHLSKIGNAHPRFSEEGVYFGQQVVVRRGDHGAEYIRFRGHVNRPLSKTCKFIRNRGYSDHV